MKDNCETSEAQGTNDTQSRLTWVASVVQRWNACLASIKFNPSTGEKIYSRLTQFKPMPSYLIVMGWCNSVKSKPYQIQKGKKTKRVRKNPPVLERRKAPSSPKY